MTNAVEIPEFHFSIEFWDQSHDFNPSWSLHFAGIIGINFVCNNRSTFDHLLSFSSSMCRAPFAEMWEEHKLIEE